MIIGAGAFQSKQLTSVTAPNSVTNIGNYAFQSNQLTNVIIPDSVTNLGSYAFSHNQLTSLQLSNSLTAISSNAFYSNKLTDLTIPDSVVTIDRFSFYGNQLTGLTIPDGVTAIGVTAFANNKLTSIQLGSSIKTIGINAFYGNQLVSVTIPDSVTTIGASAFYGNRLTSLQLGSSVTTIGSEAFQFNQLTNVIVPNSLTSIGSLAFARQNPLGSGWTGDRDTLWYARLLIYPFNTHSLADSTAILGANNNGGYLINPASATTNYVDSRGNELKSSETVTGKLPDGTALTNYLVTQGPTIADSSNPVELAAYTRAGAEKSFTPPVIGGYVTPAAQTKTLAAGENIVTFVYYTQAEVDAQNTPKVTVAPSSPTTITVSWNPIPTANTYTIQYKPKGSGEWKTATVITDSATSTYTIEGLAAGASYDIKILTALQDGTSTTSALVSTTLMGMSGKGLAETGEKLYLLAGVGEAVFIVGLAAAIFVLRRSR